MAFAKEGAAVAVVVWNTETGPRVAQEIKDLGGRSLFVQCDVCFRDQVNRAVAATVDEFGTVDVLVNAAQDRQGSPLEEVTDELLDLCWRSGPVASLYFMQACFPYFKEKRRGKIINFGSGGAINGTAGFGALWMAKNAILCLTRVAAREWGDYNINVNCIGPNAPHSSKISKARTPEQDRAWLQAIPLGRYGDAERDIGRAAVFLASADSDYITGQNIQVDGGHTMYQ